jgi:hypothetical protein
MNTLRNVNEVSQYLMCILNIVYTHELRVANGVFAKYRIIIIILCLRQYRLQ